MKSTLKITSLLAHTLLLGILVSSSGYTLASNVLHNKDTEQHTHTCHCPQKKIVQHIVLLTFKPGSSEKQIQNVFKALKDLKRVIPQIKSFSAGKYYSNEGLNRGYTHAFIMHFDNAKARDYYLDHPEHKRVANEIVLPALQNGKSSVLAFDYQS